MVLFSCLLFLLLLFFLAPLHGENKEDNDTITLQNLLLNGSVEEAYLWMTQDALTIVESSSHGQLLTTALLLMEAAKVVRKMPGGGGYAAIKALQYYSSSIAKNDEIAAYHFFMGQTVQYYCDYSFSNTPNEMYCTNQTAQVEMITYHYEQAYHLYKIYGINGVDFDISGMLNDLAIILGNQRGVEHSKIIGILEEAINIAPKSIPPFINLATALSKFDNANITRILALLERALELSTQEDTQTSVFTRANLWHNYATTLHESGIDGYVDAWQEAVRLNPFQFESQVDLATTFCTAGQMDTAINVFDNALHNILELSTGTMTPTDKSFLGNRNIYEMMLLTLILKTTTIIPQIFNSKQHAKDIRRQYISNLMVLDDELRELQLGWIDYRNNDISSSVSSLERLGDLIKYANLVKSTQLYSSPLSCIGCGSLGYYLIYEGGVDVLPRTLLARLYRSKFPELSYTAPFLRQTNAFDSTAAVKSKKRFIKYILSTNSNDANKRIELDDVARENDCNLQTCEAAAAAAAVDATITIAIDSEGKISNENTNYQQQKVVVNRIPVISTKQQPTLPKIKIAFLSAFWFRHSVGILLSDVIASISRNLFEVILISTSQAITIQLTDDKKKENKESPQFIIKNDIPVFINGVELQETTQGSGFIKSIVGGDMFTSKIWNSCSMIDIYTTKDLKLIQESISSLELDVLVYGEIGMDAKTYFLGFSQLAIRTLAFWGHATTSGISGSDIYLNDDINEKRQEMEERRYQGGGIDFFISSHLFETEGRQAQRKYSERLILMSGMVSSFPTPPLPLSSHIYYSDSSPTTTSSSSFKEKRVSQKRQFLIYIYPELQNILPTFDDDFTLYSIPQTLYKVHPDFDELIRLILMKDTKGYIVVPKGHQHPNWLHILEQRLKKNIGDILLKRIIFLRFMSDLEYLALNSVSDVVLDTFPVGGGRSSYEIFSVDTPIVLLYPRTSILQLTTGMYKTMGFFDENHMLSHHVITHTEEDFVTAAVEIANNETRQELIRNLISQNKGRLYTSSSSFSNENSNAVGIMNRWEPNSLQDILEYFNDSVNLSNNQYTKSAMHHTTRIIQEWNRLLLYLGSYSKDIDQRKIIQKRGWEYEKALSLQEDITFQLSSDGQYLEVLIDEGDLLD